jgi:hypothetical protein
MNLNRLVPISLIALSLSVVIPIANAEGCSGAPSSNTRNPDTGAPLSEGQQFFVTNQSGGPNGTVLLVTAVYSTNPGGSVWSNNGAWGTVVVGGTLVMGASHTYYPPGCKTVTPVAVSTPTPTPTPSATDTRTATTTPSAVTLTATNGSSSQSGLPISGSISLRYLANSISNIASIQTILKSSPSGASPISISGGSGTVTPTSIGIVSLNLSPTISPTVAGTYTYTVVATFTGFPASTTTVDMSFTLTSSINSIS